MDPIVEAKRKRFIEIRQRNPNASREDIIASVEREFEQRTAMPGFQAESTGKIGAGSASDELGPGEFAKGAGRSLMQGLTANFWDEIEAGARSLGPRDYRTIRDEIRGKQERFQSENPKLSTGLEIGGGIAPVVAATLVGGPVGGGAAASRLLPRMATGMATGGAYGAASGAGMAPEMKDVPRGLAVGGAVGTVLGGALPLAGAGLGAAGRGAMNVFDKTARSIADAGGMLSPMARQVIPALDERAGRIAQQNIAQKLADDALTPQQAADNLAAMQSRGVPAAVVDVGEENTLELLNSSYLVPGPGRRTASQYVQQRVAGLAGRLAEQVERLANVKLENLNAVVRQIAKERAAPARELYTKAFTSGPIQISDEVAGLIKSPATGDLRKAWLEGWRRSTLDDELGEAGSGLPALKPLFKTVKDQSGKESLELARAIEVRDIDYMKRGLDAQINRELGSAKPDGDLIRLLEATRKRLLAEADAQVPAYAEARAFWGGKQGLMDALEKGKRFQYGSDDDFADLIAGMTPDEIVMFRRGAANQIAEDLRERGGRTVSTLNVLTDPTAQNRLRAIFPDEESFNLLKRIVEDEVKGAAPYRRLTGQSQTAQNLAGLGDLVMSSSAGLPLDPKAAAMQSLFNLMSGNTRAVAEQQARMLTRSGPQAVDFLRSLQLNPSAANQAVRALLGTPSQSIVAGRVGGNVGGRR